MTTNTLVCPLCGKLYFSPCDHTARDLIAEIERLNAALDEIAAHPTHCANGDPMPADAVITIARAALEKREAANE